MQRARWRLRCLHSRQYFPPPPLPGPWAREVFPVDVLCSTAGGRKRMVLDLALDLGLDINLVDVMLWVCDALLDGIFEMGIW